MIVTCNSLDEFIAELELSKGNTYQKLVRVSISKNPLLEKPHQNPREAVRTEIILQASAIIETSDGGQYLTQFGTKCGIDYSDTSQSYEGTKQAEAVKKKIKLNCDKLGLKIGPGVLEI